LVAVVLALSQPGLTVELATTTPEFKLGAEVVFEARLTNPKRTEILVVPQGDGMHEGRKLPLAQIQVRTPGGEWSVPTIPGCGNTDPIQPQDFKPVSPGKSIDLLNGMAWSKHAVWSAFKTPGTYEVRFVYETTAPLEKWIGGPVGPEAAAKLAIQVQPMFVRVPKVRLVSNTLTVRVTAS
jgi:hypothetical protein